MFELKISSQILLSFMLEQYPLWLKCPNIDLHYYEALIKGFHIIYYSCVQNDYYIAFYVDYRGWLPDEKVTLFSDHWPSS